VSLIHQVNIDSESYRKGEIIMKFLRSVLGYAIAGMFVMSVWGPMASLESFGIIGGWFAAFAIIGPMWFLNHYVGLIPHESDSGWVDMALGIGVAGVMRDVFLAGSVDPLVATLPTLGLVILGGVLGGYVAAKVEESMEAK
jgi:hypothetical protein